MTGVPNEFAAQAVQGVNGYDLSEHGSPVAIGSGIGLFTSTFGEAFECNCPDWRGLGHPGRPSRGLSQVTGLGLEPRTNGLTYLIGFRRPPEPDPEKPRGQGPGVLSVWTIPSPSHA